MLLIVTPPAPPTPTTAQFRNCDNLNMWTSQHYTGKNKLLKRLGNICIEVSVAIFNHYSIVGFFVCFSEVS